jgi:hypothetical protein
VTRLARRIADSLVLPLLFVLAACSGAVSGPAQTVAGAPLAISPQSAVVYSDVPAKFVITGGTAPYFISSSDGKALPVPSGSFNYNNLTVVPGIVGADTSVTLSATDAKNSTTVSATLTVRPRTVSNVVTVTPTTSCNGGLCPGGDALVRVVLSLNGVPLAGRTVRFSVVSGAISVITTTSGIDTPGPSGTAVTDANGAATIRVQANPNASAQTALLDVTDVVTGYTVRTAISIAPSPTAALNAQPSTITFQGTAPGTCATDTQADVIVFGGKPPYSISNPGAFTVDPIVVTSNPGRFTVTATGQCSAGSSIAIVDANGATVSVTATNKLSDVQPAPTPAFTVVPTAVTLASCSDFASVALTGGTGNYFGAGTESIQAFVTQDANGNTIGQISRTPDTPSTGSSGPGTGPFNVVFSDGQSSKTVAVTLSGDAANTTCP